MVRLTQATLLNISPARCAEVPVPNVPYESLFGSAFAAAIISATDWIGDCGLTTTMLNERAMSATGVNAPMRIVGQLGIQAWIDSVSEGAHQQRVAVGLAGRDS